MKCYGWDFSDLSKSAVLTCYGCGGEFNSLNKCQHDELTEEEQLEGYEPIAPAHKSVTDYYICLCDECLNNIDYVLDIGWYACNGWNGIVVKRDI